MLILIPTDFSANATRALNYALRIGYSLKSRFLIFHASQMSAYEIMKSGSEMEMEKVIEKDTHEKVTRMKTQVFKALKSLDLEKLNNKIDYLIESSPYMVDKTISLAKKFKADLIVMGTHGASGIQKFLFGSNTSNMISKSDIPVLAVPENYRYQAVKNILYASDMENPVRELKKIIPFAAGLKAGIEILHFDYGISLTLKESIRKALNKSGYKKITITTLKGVLEKPLLTQIRNYMDKKQPQWLVMFTKKRGFWDKLMIGSKTEDMASALKVPLLSLKKQRSK